ncbi:MAG TPA: hypothetical protein VET26_01770 [Candidatus Sulfotelmatobacter sp.]|nr:hypothetical protein [Candidatus Sulfotelmatobacter sp.]
MTRDGERMIELINEMGSRVSHLLSDMVPPSAQVHLMNAQRELITALMLIYEHRVAGPEGGRPAGRGRTRAAQTRRRSAKRVGKIPID